VGQAGGVGRREGVKQLGDHIADAVLDDHVLQPDQAGMVDGGRGPRLGRHPVPAVRLPMATRLHPGRELDLLDRELAAGWVGGPPDQAVLGAAEGGVQRPAACDKPPAGVL
jgi:hypothetical protein